MDSKSINMDVASLLENRARKHPDKPALIFRNQIVTFSQLRDYAFRFADTLDKSGLKKGERLGIYLPNCPEYIFSYLAAWCLGLTAVPLDFMLTEEELTSCLSHCEAGLLIANPKPHISFDSLKRSIPSLKDIINFQDKNAGGIDKKPQVKIQDKDYAIIFYTSGTTGKPKGVLINYLQLGASPLGISYFAGLGESDTALCSLPLSHLGGMLSLSSIIFLGTTVVMMERFIPFEFLKNIESHKITCFWLVPSMYYALLQLKEFESFDLSSLRWIVCFGASSSPEALRRFHQYCPKAHFLNGWGLTETNAPTCVLPMGSNKIESVGRPAPWIEVRIFDEDDKEVSQGKVGEIAVKSWVVTDGYYKDPETTRSCIRGGWFYTGDLGRIDEENDLYIVGRKKEMIKVGGEIVFEPEVESVLYKHPGVAEAAVIGVKDKLRGEIPKAFLVLKEGQNIAIEDLRYFLRQHLAHFKIPHYFEFLQSLPKNRSGKIDKEELRSKPATLP